MNIAETFGQPFISRDPLRVNGGDFARRLVLGRWRNYLKSIVRLKNRIACQIVVRALHSKPVAKGEGAPVATRAARSFILAILGVEFLRRRGIAASC